jgi:RimJ/RimL family protein N-acetyltransferase
MIRARIETLAAIRARFGWRQTTHVGVLWLLRQSIGYREALIFCLDLEAVKQPSTIESFTWGYMGLDDIEPHLLAAAGLDETDLESFVRRGERCFTGTSDGRVCYMSIVSRSGFSVPERAAVQFDDGSGDSYVGNCFTVEQYRGRGLYPCALLQLGSTLRAEGCRRLYLFVERENLASIRSVEKAGFRRVAVCRVFNWHGRMRRSCRMFGRSAGGTSTPDEFRFMPFNATAPTR